MKFKLKTSQGQLEIGFIDMYELEYSKKAICVVNYLPQFKEIKTQSIHVTLLLEGRKGDWSDGEIKEMLNDMGEYIKINESAKFKSGEKLDYFNTQMFYISKLTDVELLSHGDFSYR